MPMDASVTDYLGFRDRLTNEERGRLAALREMLEREAAPVVDEYWAKAEFPTHLVRPIAEHGVFGMGFAESRQFESSALYRGFATFELARVDASLATFLGVQSGLVIGSIGLLGSQEQRDRWLPGLGRGEIVGACGITEPQSGSDTSRGIATTAERRGDTWVLNGRKRWIGNATWSDITIIYARDVADGKVKAFVVPTDSPGYAATKIEDKFSFRIVQNADIELTDVEVPEANRLQHCDGFGDLSRVLHLTRIESSWIAAGLSAGAFELTLDYTKRREQFGRPVASFQMVQDSLVKCLTNIQTSLGLVVRLSEMVDEGVEFGDQAALTKAYTTQRARETVSMCRDLHGGNGIDLAYGVIRFFADAEAAHTVEGTREMNTLIVGRAITGHSAFL